MEKGHFARACRQKENKKRKIPNVTEEETTRIGNESDQAYSSIYRIEKINRITDKRKHLTTSVKMNGTEKSFIVDSGSPVPIMPADDNIVKKTKIQNLKHRYQDLNKKGVKFCGQIPVDIEYENNKQNMQILITEKDDITPLLGMDWLN